MQNYISKRNFECGVDDFYKAKMVYRLQTGFGGNDALEKEMAMLKYVDGDCGYNSMTSNKTTNVSKTTSDVSDVKPLTFGNIGHDCTVITSDGYTFKWVD